FLAAFEQRGRHLHDQFEHLLAGLRSQLTDVGGRMLATATTLKVYVEEGGVADVAEFSMSVNGLRDQVEAIGTGLRTIDEAVRGFSRASHNMARLPETMFELKNAIQALQQGGDRVESAGKAFRETCAGF